MAHCERLRTHLPLVYPLTETTPLFQSPRNIPYFLRVFQSQTASLAHVFSLRRFRCVLVPAGHRKSLSCVSAAAQTDYRTKKSSIFVAQTYSATLFTVVLLSSAPLSFCARSGRSSLEIELRVCGYTYGPSPNSADLRRHYRHILWRILLLRTLLHCLCCFPTPASYCSILKYVSPAAHVSTVYSVPILQCITAPRKRLIT